LHDVLSSWTPQYWQFWIGLILVILVLIGRERLQRWIMWAPDRIKAMFDARKGPEKSTEAPAAGEKSP
jgi:branched-chain amino acid transport system permease protein